jgi:soluble lytic murein transglycosylase-like protein
VGDDGENGTMVGGAEGFPREVTAVGKGGVIRLMEAGPRGQDVLDAGVGFRLRRTVEQALQQFRRDTHEIATEDQGPGRRAIEEGGFDACQRALAGAEVGNHRPGEMRVAVWRSNQSNGACYGGEGGGQVLHESTILIGKKRLVAPHASAAPTHQNVATAGHESIIASGHTFSPLESYMKQAIILANNRMGFCLLALLFAVPGWSETSGIPAVTAVGGSSALSSARVARAQDSRVVYTSTVAKDARTGRLVRKVAVKKAPSAAVKTVARVPEQASRRAAVVSASGTGKTGGAREGIDVRAIVEETAKRHEVDPDLVHSVVKTESNYNPLAVSPKGAQGLMQLMPATARRFGVTDSFDIRQNVEGGVRYLKHLLGLFPDDMRLALAAYNAGEHAVVRYGWIPPYAETQQYVRLVGQRYNEAKQRNGSTAPVPTGAAPTNPAEADHPVIAVYVDDQGKVYYQTR